MPWKENVYAEFVRQEFVRQEFVRQTGRELLGNRSESTSPVWKM